MAKITIHGSSDDLIYVDGEIPGCDEHYPDSEGQAFIHLSTGDVFQIKYDGVWTVEHVVVKDALLKIKKAPNRGCDSDEYSDFVDVTGNIEWVEVWKSANGPSCEELAKLLCRDLESESDWEDLGLEKLKAIREIVNHE